MTENIAADNLEQHLGGNPYPGRGLVIGRSDQDQWIQVYWIMGRSPHSRNRFFVAEGDILRTQAADPSKVEDPSLIIYNAMRRSGKRFIVTNGTQTDTVFDGFGARHSFVDSLLTESHEPDPPNYTPRISGCLDLSSGDPSLWLCVIEASPFDSDHSGHHFYHYTSVPPGYGYCVTTYQGDGDPLPSFEGSPMLMPLRGSPDEIAEAYWDVLDEENRISLAVQRIDADGVIASIAVINKYTTT